MINKIAIIGGTGSMTFTGITHSKAVHTPYGDPSSALSFGNIGDQAIVFLPRHGIPHAIPPHRINYRANIYALKDSGVTHIIAINTVGGIVAAMYPERVVIPQQIIDYTYGRQHTFFDSPEGLALTHINFTHPYSISLRAQLTSTPVMADHDLFVGGTYGVVQGPRLETAAEIDRLEKDGCDIVGMTGMPEAALARELEIDYACIALVVNWAAGRSDEDITSAIIEKHLKSGMKKVNKILEKTLTLLR